jgi:hypothetical protein
MANDHDTKLVQDFEALQPETSVNLNKAGGLNEQIRLSDKLLAFIEKYGIDNELKDKVCINILQFHVVVVLLFLISYNRILEDGSQLYAHPRYLWTAHTH